MLKRICLFLSALLLLPLTACGPKTPSPYGDIPEGEIVFYTQFTEYPPDTPQIQAVIQNVTSDELLHGAPWSMERKQGDTWYTMPSVEYAFSNQPPYTVAACLNYVITAYTLEAKLTPGEYRLVKQIDDAPVAAEFTVTEEAFQYEALTDLPKKYTAADAGADGVIIVGDTLSDTERLRTFFAHRALGLDGHIRLGRETEAGLVLTDVVTNRRRSGCITVTTDASRAGGEVTTAYYGHILSFNGDIFFANTPTWKGILEKQTVRMLSENAAGQAAYVFEPYMEAAIPTNAGKFWSPDGRQVVTITASGEKFSLSQHLDTNTEFSGAHMLDIPPEYKMGLPIGAVWDSDTRHVVLICEALEASRLSFDVMVYPFGYVFYDTETNEFTGYTYSSHHYTVDSDGHILIPE